MKHFIFSLTFIFLCTLSSQAQVGINTATPNTSAALDVTSTDKGLLIPRVASTGDVTAPTAGMMGYQTGSPAGFYFYSTSWNLVGGSSGDNLGNHTATQNLAMGNNSITGANDITASGNVTVNSHIITRTSVAITNNSLPGANRILSTDWPITTTPSYVDITAYPTASAAWTLHGIPGGVDGKIVYIRNTNINYHLSLQLNSTAESDGNKIYAAQFPGTSTAEVIYTFMYQQSLFSGAGGWLYMGKVE